MITLTFGRYDSLAWICDLAIGFDLGFGTGGICDLGLGISGIRDLGFGIGGICDLVFGTLGTLGFGTGIPI